MDINTIKAYISDIPCLFSLGPEEASKLVFYMAYRKFLKGDTLFKEGDQGDAVYFVIRGSVDILKESMSGTNIKLATISRDGIIGEMSLIETAPRSATAVANEETETMFMPKEKFTALLENLPAIGNKILHRFAITLSQRVRFLSGKMADTIDKQEKTRNE